MITNKNIDELPYSLESETSLLGAIMSHNELFDRMSFLKPEHFYFQLHQRIFIACKDKFNSEVIANPLTLKQQFDKDEDFNASGGFKYLVSCLGAATHNPVEIARHVRDISLRRDLINAFDKARVSLVQGATDIAIEASRVAEICESINAGEREWDIRNGEEVSQSIIDGLNTHLNPFKTGIERLNDAMGGGIYPSKLYGLGGKKKHGKTILAGTLSCNLAIEGVKHLFICGEMSPEEIHQRNLARMGGFFPSSFRNGYNKSDDFAKKFSESMKWQQKNILYRNAPGMTFEQLKQIIRRAIVHHRIKGFILDYIQLVGGKEHRKSTAEHMDEVAQWLADICRKYHVFGIVTAQINQEGNTRGGEGLRLACDQMYAIQRPDITQPAMWLEMMDTRYTSWMNIGSETDWKMELEPKGPWFKEL